MGLDPRIGRAIPAARASASAARCFPKDVQALEFMAEEANCHPQLLRAVLEINRDGRRSFVRKLDRLVGGLEGTTIAIWGLAFKPNTDDLREAAALEIIADLLARGARVRAYDPAAMDGARALLNPARITFCDDAYDGGGGGRRGRAGDGVERVQAARSGAGARRVCARRSWSMAATSTTRAT